MVYLKSFSFPTAEKEENYLHDFYSSYVYGNQYYTNFYPFGVLSEIGCQKLDFEPITILYGGNGSGKSTILNVIAKKLNLERMSAYNTSNHMDAYVDLCLRETDLGWMTGEFDLDNLSKISHVITSDDIFRKVLQDRTKKRSEYNEKQNVDQGAPTDKIRGKGFFGYNKRWRAEEVSQ